jgi:hypothetical protein
VPTDRPNKSRLTINVTIDEALRIRITQLGISPASVAKAALKAEVKRVEKNRILRAIQKEDPRVSESDLRKNSVRIQNLKKMASVEEPFLDVESVSH